MVGRIAPLAIALALAPAVASGRGWLGLDQAKLQTAGNLGVAAGGAGWGFWGTRLEADVLVGWVPPSVAGEHIFTATSKLTWQPTRLGHRGWLLRPLTVGGQLTYTPGDAFFVWSGYYAIPTALRAGLMLGGSLVRTRVRHVREVGVYWEAVALDSGLRHWAFNRRTTGAGDVLSLALGVRVAR
jgi:hypothetical protein